MTLWTHDNLHAWCVVPYDARRRNPEQRADMLQRLGFNRFAYDWRDENIPEFGAEIEALKRRDIEVLAWWFPLDPDDPRATAMLETFKRHDVQPQLWVNHIDADFDAIAAIREGMQRLLPGWSELPSSAEGHAALTEAERAQWIEAYVRVVTLHYGEELSASPEYHERRLLAEVERTEALAALARPYGCKVALYNHNGWLGMVENQVAIIESLRRRGVSDAGIVYNFSHARDEHHDDSRTFAAVWSLIEPYTLAVNLTGMQMEGQFVYPSQGDGELEMMRIVEDSGWRGSVGLIAEKGGDAELTLRNYMIGLDWLAAELRAPGSAGPRPFPALATDHDL